MEEKGQFGLVLSGGGARGIAHIGAIQALEEHGLYPDLIAGASAGAIVGTLYASGMSPKDMLDFVREISLFKIFKPELPYAGLVKLTYLKNRILEVVPEDTFEALERKLLVATSNLNTGKCVLFESGSLSKAVVASSSIPLLFKPMRIEDQLYVDGGLLNNLPVDGLKERAGRVFAVNVMPDEVVSTQSINSVFGIAMRAFELSIIANTRPQLQAADWVVQPHGMREYTIFQLNKYQEIFERGYEAAQKVLDQSELTSSTGKRSV